MKRSFSLLPVLSLLCALSLLFSLAGCSSDNDNCLPEDLPADKIVQTDLTALRCRVVSVDENSTVLLAGVDAENPDIYTLGADERTADAQLSVGDLVEVRCASTLETYPARFAEVESVTVLPDEFDDRCALYLRVLNNLWSADEGLNSDVTMVSVDLSATSLTPAERSAVAWAFAQSHGITLPLELNYEELCEEGYISGLTDEDALPHWEDGILFTITETDEPVAFNLPDLSQGEELPSMAQYNVKNTVSFDASKWRTALGAYGFSHCVAVQANDGMWGNYSITGGEWIS